MINHLNNNNLIGASCHSWLFIHKVFGLLVFQSFCLLIQVGKKQSVNAAAVDRPPHLLLVHHRHLHPHHPLLHRVHRTHPATVGVALAAAVRLHLQSLQHMQESVSGFFVLNCIYCFYELCALLIYMLNLCFHNNCTNINLSFQCVVFFLDSRSKSRKQTKKRKKEKKPKKVIFDILSNFIKLATGFI